METRTWRSRVPVGGGCSCSGLNGRAGWQARTWDPAGRSEQSRARAGRRIQGCRPTACRPHRHNQNHLENIQWLPGAVWRLGGHDRASFALRRFCTCGATVTARSASGGRAQRRRTHSRKPKISCILTLSGGSAIAPAVKSRQAPAAEACGVLGSQHHVQPTVTEWEPELHPWNANKNIKMMTCRQ